MIFMNIIKSVYGLYKSILQFKTFKLLKIEINNKPFIFF
jgi:hypothetical protein